MTATTMDNILTVDDQEKMEAAFRRSLFVNEKQTSRMSTTMQQYQRTQQHHAQQKVVIIPSSTEQRQWYAEERALLRELVVLTLRHTDGSMIRFLPSEEDQIRLLWDTHGHPEGGRYAPNNVVLPGGVRLAPTIEVVPPASWTNTTNYDNYDDEIITATAAKQGRMDDIEFRAGLPMPLLGSGARDAIALCSEVGWMYGRIIAYVNSVFDDIDGVQCATSHALAARLDAELAEYHDQLATLEKELPPLELMSSFTSQPHHRFLTLRSLVSRLIPLRDHLRTLSILADGIGSCADLRGGKLLAMILRHSLDGNHTRHTNLIRSIAADCSVPWYKILTQWLTQGVLEDLHSEFFVKEVRTTDTVSSSTGGRRQHIALSSGFYTWHRRYILIDGLIPACSCGGMMDIITVDLAHEVLLVGKGINFIRHCLQDKDWEVVEQNDQGYSNSFATLSDVGDNAADEMKCLSTLNDVVQRSSTRVHTHILDSLHNEHHIMQHLLALKHFLFLGQGDFVSSLVESLDQEFRGRTLIAGIYDHTLSALLEGSLRSSTARFLPNFVLGNLGAKLMMDNYDPNRYWMGNPPKTKEFELTPWKDNEGTTQDPWDFIYLDYNIDSPLDAIVHASAMDIYHQVFLFLFRLKRVEWMLNNSWRQSTALNHAILIETKAGGADASTISEAAELSSFLLRRISSTRQTMLHFVSNLQNYLMFEVLEGGWESLKVAVKNARTVDDVIKAHDSYLNQIVDKTLLCIDDEDGNNGESLETLLRELLSIALKFGKFQDHIFVNSLAGLDKAAKMRSQVDERAEKGGWGRTTLDKDEGKVFIYLADARLFEFVEHTAKDFDTALCDLLKMLSKQIDDVDFNASTDDDQDETHHVMKNHDALPYLLFRLDFSGYYARQANQKKRQSSS